jgi:hypothetical protein
MRHWIAALALCAVAGCAGQGTVITSDGAESPYNYLDYLNAADGRAFLVEVRGVPFAGMTQDAFDARLMPIMTSARPPRPAAAYTTRRDAPGMMPAYRLVLVFNPARNLSHQTQCSALDSVQPGAPVPGRVRVSVAFCRKDDLMSKAVAVTTAAGIDDPAFRQMFVELYPVMFPPWNPFIDGPAQGWD